MNRDNVFLDWNNDNIMNFWDHWSHFPEYYFTYQFGDVIVDKLKKHLKNAESILDYGCGTGYLIKHLLKLGSQVTGLDFSNKSIETTNKLYQGQDHFSGAFSPEQIFSSGKKFDRIISIEVIEHLDDAILKSMMNQIKNLLSKEGLVIFTTPNEEVLSDSYVYCPESGKTFHRWQHVRSWSKDSLSKFLKNEGFEVVQTYTTDLSVSAKAGKNKFILHQLKKLTKGPMPHLVCVAKKSSSV